MPEHLQIILEDVSMYAIVQTGGKQYEAKEGIKMRVDHLKVDVGDELELNNLLMVSGDDRGILTGDQLTGVRVVTEVIEQELGDKIVIMKFRRRKHYKRKMGHRQRYTWLLVKSIKFPDNA